MHRCVYVALAMLSMPMLASAQAVMVCPDKHDSRVYKDGPCTTEDGQPGTWVVVEYIIRRYRPDIDLLPRLDPFGLSGGPLGCVEVRVDPDPDRAPIRGCLPNQLPDPFDDVSWQYPSGDLPSWGECALDQLYP